MREIRQSGSEGGAAMSRPYPYRVEITVTLLCEPVLRSYIMAIFESIVTLLKEGESFVLATILSRCGSAPRDVGSRMIIRSDGTIIISAFDH